MKTGLMQKVLPLVARLRVVSTHSAIDPRPASAHPPVTEQGLRSNYAAARDTGLLPLVAGIVMQGFRAVQEARVWGLEQTLTEPRSVAL